MGAEENVELVRTGFDAYERRDFEAVLALLDPDVEIYTDETMINSGTYRGHDGFIEWIQRWNEAWDDFTNEIVSIDPVGESHVVARVDQRGVGAVSGVEVQMSIAYMWEARDGKATRVHLYSDVDKATGVARSLSADPE